MAVFFRKKNGRLFARLLAPLLALSLLAGCAPQPGLPARIHPEDASLRRTVPFAEMQIGEANADELAASLQKLAGEAAAMNRVEDLLMREERLAEGLENFWTSRSLADLASYLDTADEAARARSTEFNTQAQALDSAVNDYLRTVLESKLGPAYRKAMGPYISACMDVQLQTSHPSAVPPLQRRAELDSEYNDLLANLRVTVRGEQLRFEEALALPDLTEDELVRALTDYFLDNYTRFGEIYLEMIEQDKLAAFCCGFDYDTEAPLWNYRRMGREYAPEDAEKLFRQVKRYLVPLAAGDITPLDSYPLGQEQGAALVRDILREADPLMAEGWDHLQKYGLISVAPSPGKMSGIAFTTTLSAYDAPFVYTYWQGTLRDGMSLVHEFGHAMDEYAQFGHEAYAQDLDKCEVFSQGLELVLMPRIAQAAGLDAAALQRAQYADILDTIVYQTLLEEFQFEAYRLPAAASPEDLNRLYGRLMKEYGYQSIFGESDPTWFEITHLFDAPFYTISYVTSATAALELGRLESETGGAGLDAWLTLLHTDRDCSFTDFIACAGIPSPFEDGRIRDCAKFLRGQLAV